jgi:hypothetical protein
MRPRQSDDSDLSVSPTQKPAAHRCGRVLGETIDFEQNTMVDRTGQPKCEFFIHRLLSLEEPCPTKAPPLDAAKPALTGDEGAALPRVF